MDWVVDLSPEDLAVRSFDEDSFNLDEPQSDALLLFQFTSKEGSAFDWDFSSTRQSTKANSLSPQEFGESNVTIGPQIGPALGQHARQRAWSG